MILSRNHLTFRLQLSFRCLFFLNTKCIKYWKVSPVGSHSWNRLIQYFSIHPKRAGALVKSLPSLSLLEESCTFASTPNHDPPSKLCVDGSKLHTLELVYSLFFNTENWHIPPGEQENYLQRVFLEGYVSSQQVKIFEFGWRMNTSDKNTMFRRGWCFFFVETKFLRPWPDMSKNLGGWSLGSSCLARPLSPKR